MGFLQRATAGPRRQLATAGLPPQVAVLQLATGAWVAQALFVAAQLRLADLLKDGPRSTDELAAATEAHPPSLYRVLRALANVGVFELQPDGRFRTNRFGRALESDAGWSVRPLVAMLGDDWHWRAWGRILESVRSGEPAFRRAHGADLFPYLAAHPGAARAYNEAMSSTSRLTHDAVVAAYDFAPFRRIVDVGGGYGGLISAVLRANPAAGGVLFDLPEVVEEARARIGAAGLADRCQVVGGDFFDAVPAGADLYLLSEVLHGWHDERAAVILRSCRRAVAPGGRLLAVDLVLPPAAEPFFGKLLDLEMLVVGGGKERTAAEYRALLGAAGWRLTAVYPTMSLVSVVEAVPV